MKTGVLIHGCDVNADFWTRAVWGKPPHRVGRIPKGILVTHQENADVIVLGTGASVKDGLKEASYTKKYMLDHWDRLTEFTEFQKLPATRLLKLREKMGGAIVEESSLNTQQEVERAGEIFLDRDIERVILVSTPTHLPRCIRDAFSVYEHERFASLRHNLFAAPSDCRFWGDRTSDPVIIEFPHKPGQELNFRLAQLGGRIFEIPKDKMTDFLTAFNALIERFV